MKIDVNIRGGFVADCRDDEDLDELIQAVRDELNAAIGKIKRKHTTMSSVFVELETE
ncbi:MAG: hypothetical protein NC324_02615 [Bacteroides sp.]|nr:hypothetical protein [Bacteroides sp.]